MNQGKMFDFICFGPEVSVTWVSDSDKVQVWQ
jgi:hypothetical protein